MRLSKLSDLKKILIANRGEIACRVIRTARKLGVKTAAVYSEVDSDALHVKLADEAYFIGGAQAQDSYLKGNLILDVAKTCGAQAIHPGYGFLSENAEFAASCEESGVVFIGPPASAIRDMGIKSTSKAIMEKAGVAVVPGYHGEDQTVSVLKAKADEIGYPIMIKAVRGGGGKGMRIARTSSEFDSALESAKRESLRSFGNDAVLLERYVANPRHVEVQVFADSHGNAVHLFERDCSVQRRHQKVIEQAPAPGVDDRTRKELGDAGVRAAKAVGYVNAGTVEFIYDTDDSKFYFMEMNTRLQVEHPVTEMVTGVDLVEWQLRIAAGEPLPVRQEHISLNGSAVEARIYAETLTSEGTFVPAVGRLSALRLPTASAGSLRIETGVEAGDEVSVHYDPMIAKLVVWAQNQESALGSLADALGDFNIVGVDSNVDFLRKLCFEPKLAQGKATTAFIDEHKDSLLPQPPTPLHLAQAAVGLVLKERAELQKSSHPNPKDPFMTESFFRVNHEYVRTVRLIYDEKEYSIRVTPRPGDRFEVNLENELILLKGRLEDDGGFSVLRLESPSRIISSRLAFTPSAIHLFNKDGDYVLNVRPVWPDGTTSENEETSSTNSATCPMPGVVEQVHVKPGDTVKRGDPLVVVIAMKMEHVIRAGRDGVVESVSAIPKATVAKNCTLVKFVD